MIQDATAKVFGVRSGDLGHALRVVVTATNSTGSANAASAADRRGHGQRGFFHDHGYPTTPATTTTAHNKAPTLTYVSLKRGRSSCLCTVP